jgi:hypothetical protein
MQPQGDLNFCLVDIQEQDGKPQAKLIAVGLPQFKNAGPKLEDVKVTDDKALHFTFKVGQVTLPFAFYPAKDDAKAKKLLGTSKLGRRLFLARLEQTELKDIEQKDIMVPDQTLQDAVKAEQQKDAKLKLALLKQLLDKKEAGAALVQQVGFNVIRMMVEAGNTEAELKPQIEKIAKLVAPYGPDAQLYTLEQVASSLLASDKLAPLALTYAREGEKLLTKSDPVDRQIPILNAVLAAMVKASTPEAEIKAQADKVLQVVAKESPAAQIQQLQTMATNLAASEKLAGLAVEYARKAEKLLGDSPAPDKQVPVLKVLVNALRKAGKADEAKTIADKVETIEVKLDTEYLKNAIPFKPVTFTGRKGKSDRVVLVELFTGAQCPPCVAADVAFDALLKTYKPEEVVLLQYHLHIPGPDPLTNNDTEARARFYTTQSTPKMFIDGQEGPPIGGYKQHAKDRYETINKSLETNLDMDSQANLKLTANRNGDDLTIQADVSDLKKTGDDVHLRLVLVEDVVRYAGSNGQRLHHHVVRAFPGGTDGLALKDKKAKHEVKINLGELNKSLNAYLAGAAKQRDVVFVDPPLDLKNLKVVAFIQDDLLREVLQVAQISLSSDKPLH